MQVGSGLIFLFFVFMFIFRFIFIFIFISTSYLLAELSSVASPATNKCMRFSGKNLRD